MTSVFKKLGCVGWRGRRRQHYFSQFEMKVQSFLHIICRDSLHLSFLKNTSVSSRTLAALAAAVTGNFSQIHLTPEGNALSCQLEAIRERA